MNRSELPILGVVLLLLVSGIAAAAGPTAVTNNDDGIVLNQPGGPAATMTGDTDIYTTTGGVDSTTVQWNTTDGNASFSSTADTKVTISKASLAGQWTNVTAVDASNADLTVNPGDKASSTVGGGVTALSYQTSSGIAVDDGAADFVYSASSSGTVTLRNLPASTTFRAATDSGSDLGSVTTDSTGTATFSVESGTDEAVYLFNARSPTIESASPEDGHKASQSDVTLSANVTDADFASSQGDTVTATFYSEGEQIDSKTISSNGTVSTTVQASIGGNRSWSVDVSDNYGEGDSIATRDFEVPSELRVYYESKPETLVTDDNISLRMRFFALESGEVISRELGDDGTINMTGLPVDERFVVTMKANESNKFVYRRIVLESIYQSERIFLLKENSTYSNVVFELEDPTGQFPPEETELFVEKPITINGTTNYYPITGDTFGATGRFPTAVQTDERYRLRVVNDGNERILGAYTATGDELAPLKIQRIEPSAEDENAGAVYGSLNRDTNTSELAVRFRGGDPDTEITYTVTDENTGEVVVPETTTVAGKFAHVYQFNTTEKMSYNVSYEVTYADGETQTGYFIAGEIGSIGQRFNIDPQVLSIISWGAILASMGLIVIVDRKLAPAVGTGMATLLTIIGTVAIPMPMIGVAGAVSVLTLFGGRR